MQAKSGSRWGAAVMAGLLLAAGTAALAEKPAQDGPRNEARPGRGQGAEWRNYYQEREQRQSSERQEKSQRERAWKDYGRERQRHVEQGPNAQGGPVADIRIGGYFGYPQRVEIGNYYREQARRGFCPPGLAKKDNGCQPPGQQRVWAVGRPLPPDAVYYRLEPAVQVRIGVPPPGHEFVRIASDILLIAVGTGMVVDAIEDLGR